MNTQTRAILLETATAVVRRQGYSGFSYADLADAVGIRKPSIHHHFPNKEDLGVAMVAVYTEDFIERLRSIEAETNSAIERIEAYAGLYRQGLAAGQGCLCGVLASEISALPSRVQAGVREFFKLNLRWLEQTLRAGRIDGDLRHTIQAGREARTALSTLQGAMFVALSLREPEVFDAAVTGMLAGLRTVNRQALRRGSARQSLSNPQGPRR
jgi:TetR/AcrR family transcriptional repressor of nem operon